MSTYDRKLTWRQRNKAKWNEYAKLWRRKKKEELGDYWTTYNTRWRKKNPKRYLLHNAKRGAKDRNLTFNITEEDIKIPAVCPVFGTELVITVPANKDEKDNTPSIDRFDSSRGYEKDNISVISWRANNLKSNGTLDEFRKLVKWMENEEKEKLQRGV